MSYEDLDGLRSKLDKMTEKIIRRFKERSDYKLNRAVYAKGQESLVDGKYSDSISLFELSLVGMEEYHAKLGRFKYPDQHTLVTERKNLPRPKVHREVTIPTIPRVKIDIKDDLIPFYLKFIEELCEDADDPSTYGETVYCDADIIQLLNERVNLGRYVANIKLKRDPSIELLWTDPAAIREKLTHLKREEEVVLKFKTFASKFGVSEDSAEKLARWTIEETIGVEIKYLQAVVSKKGAKGYHEYRSNASPSMS
jgi:chorismate mutase